MYDIICVGSATVDVFAKTECDLITINSPKNGTEELIAYPSGSKILMKELDFQIGGGGTNTAVAASRLGLRAAYLGNLGNDDNGKKVISMLSQENVEFVGTITDDMTNYSIVLDSQCNDRTILAYKDASEKLKYGLIDKDKIAAKWFYFCAMDVKVLEKLTKLAVKRNIKIAFNPSNYLAEKGSDNIKNILKYTHALILNNEEAELLVGRGSIPLLLHRLSKLGPKIVIITMGSEGAEILYADTIYHANTKKIKPVETTGAGDAFGASFISGLIIENSIIKALQLASANASSVISHIGAKNHLLTLKQAQKTIKKINIKVETTNLKH